MPNNPEKEKSERIRRARNVQENIAFNEAFFAEAQLAFEGTGILTKLHEYADELKIRQGVTNVFLDLPDLDINNVAPDWPVWKPSIKDNIFYKSGRTRASSMDADLTWYGDPRRTYKVSNPQYDTVNESMRYGITVRYHSDGSLEFQSAVGTVKSKDASMGLESHSSPISSNLSQFLSRSDWKSNPTLALKALAESLNNPKVELHKSFISHDDLR